MKTIYLILISISSSFAWGPVGHRTVGKIAEDYLSNSAKKHVEKILQGQTLADVAIWADHIRSDPAWSHSAYWHYVSIPDKSSYEKIKPSPHGDIIVAINRFTKDLKDPKVAMDKKREALKFLVHFIGDFHMPLHIGRADDAGGNKISLNWFGKKTNLHAIWDAEMIDMEKMGYIEYADYLKRMFKKELTNFKGLNLKEWESEAMQLRSLVYSFPAKKDQKKGWEYKYRFSVMDQVNRQLTRGGVRLAMWLNDVFKDIK